MNWTPFQISLHCQPNLINFCRNIVGSVHIFNQSSRKTKNQDREPKNVRKKLQWKKGSDITCTSLLNSSTETLHLRPTITVSDLAAAKKKQNKQKTHSFVPFLSSRSTETSFWLMTDSLSQIPSPPWPLFPPRLYRRLLVLLFVLEMGILVSSAASTGNSEISSNTFRSSSGMHSANGGPHLLSGKMKSLLRHFA